VPELSGHPASYAVSNGVSISKQPPLSPGNGASRISSSSASEIPGSVCRKRGIRMAKRTRDDTRLLRESRGGMPGAPWGSRTAGNCFILFANQSFIRILPIPFFGRHLCNTLLPYASIKRSVSVSFQIVDCVWRRLAKVTGLDTGSACGIQELVYGVFDPLLFFL